MQDPVWLHDSDNISRDKEQQLCFSFAKLQHFTHNKRCLVHWSSWQDYNFPSCESSFTSTVMSADSSECSSYGTRSHPRLLLNRCLLTVHLENDPSARALSSPWWGLCFDPLTLRSHHLNNTSRTFFNSLITVFYQSCPWFAHRFRSLPPSLPPSPPSLAPSLLPSLLLWLCLGHFSLMWSCCFCQQQKPNPPSSLCASTVAFIFSHLHWSLHFGLFLKTNLQQFPWQRAADRQTFNAWCANV